MSRILISDRVSNATVPLCFEGLIMKRRVALSSTVSLLFLEMCTSAMANVGELVPEVPLACSSATANDITDELRALHFLVAKIRGKDKANQSSYDVPFVSSYSNQRDQLNAVIKGLYAVLLAKKIIAP